jgi:hypothetical protein
MWTIKKGAVSHTRMLTVEPRRKRARLFFKKSGRMSGHPTLMSEVGRAKENHIMDYDLRVGVQARV